MNKLELFIIINILTVFLNFVFCSESQFIIIAKKNEEKYKFEFLTYFFLYFLSIKTFILCSSLNINPYLFYIFLTNYIYFILSSILCIMKLFNNKKLKKIEIIFPLVKKINI